MRETTIYPATGEGASKGGILYARGYKYQLRENAIAESGVRPCELVQHEYFAIDTDGLILVRHGYAWDGASSLAIDDPGTIYASLFHDVGYQAIRLGLIADVWRLELDRMYERLCIEGGVNRVRARYHYLALRFGGEQYNAMPEAGYPTLAAP